MDHLRRDENAALDDLALDREIDRALAIAPSPEFVARVRTRIAAGPAPSTWRLRWTFAAAATALAAAFIAAAVGTHRPDRIAVPIVTAQPLAVTTLANRSTQGLPYVVSGFPPLPKASARLAEARVAREGGSRTGVPRSRESEVLIDTRETAALRNLIAGVRDARVDLTPLLEPAGPAPMDLQPVRDIVIPPITIEPLMPGGQGERQ